MAINAHLHKNLSVFQPGLVIIAGRVAIGSTGAVGTQTGKGFAVTRTGAGRYTVTITSNGGVPAILFAQANVGFGTVTNTQAAYIVTLAASTGTFTLETVDNGTQDTVADPPSGAFLQIFAVVQNLALS